MKTITDTISVGASIQAGTANVAGRLVAFVRDLTWRLERQRSRMRLADLNDHELRDIGVTRDQAKAAASKHIFED